MISVKKYNLAFLGFGNVGRALVQLLESKRAELRDRYGLDFAFTGVASRRLGWHANPAGYAASDLIGEGTAITIHGAGQKAQSTEEQSLADLREWLAASKANVLFENTSMNPHTGQPATDTIRTALKAGVHVVTANKGPVVHAYHELRDLAAANGVRFLFEAAVMGGAPIFSLFREALPAARLRRFRGILNSTTNLILTEMEHGNNFKAAVKKAQDLGIAESDPSFDVDGWDAAVKVSALATVLMNYPLKPNDIEREGIRGLTMEQVQSAKVMGRRYKLVCQAEKRADGTVAGRVRPEQVAHDDPLAGCDGATSIILFQMDVIHGLTLSEIHPDAVTTAYGPLADFLTIVRGAQPPA
jgi:homoserine dehydrogenase